MRALSSFKNCKNPFVSSYFEIHDILSVNELTLKFNVYVVQFVQVHCTNTPSERLLPPKDVVYALADPDSTFKHYWLMSHLRCSHIHQCRFIQNIQQLLFIDF